MKCIHVSYHKCKVSKNNAYHKILKFLWAVLLHIKPKKKETHNYPRPRIITHAVSIKAARHIGFFNQKNVWYFKCQIAIYKTNSDKLNCGKIQGSTTKVSARRRAPMSNCPIHCMNGRIKTVFRHTHLFMETCDWIRLHVYARTLLSCPVPKRNVTIRYNVNVTYCFVLYLEYDNREKSLRDLKWTELI